MPNHYHLLVRQDDKHAAGLLPQRVFNSYSKAYNKPDLFSQAEQVVRQEGDPKK